MNYKVGDKVKIKEEKYKEEVTKILEKYNYIVTIKYTASGEFYTMEELGWFWYSDRIECLAKDYKEPVPINSRWELLDL